MTKEIRELLISADSVLSLIFYRKPRAIREFGDDFYHEVERLIERLRSASKQPDQPLSEPLQIAQELSDMLAEYRARLQE